MNRKHAVKQKELSGDFKGKLIFTSQTNGTRGHGRMFVKAKGKQQKQVRQLQCQKKVYWSYPILPLGHFRVHSFSDNLSQNSCIHDVVIRRATMCQKV